MPVCALGKHFLRKLHTKACKYAEGRVEDMGFLTILVYLYSYASMQAR